ncbi:MAG: glycoside hydrolase family 140 protein [Lachnospiraceae bacterium]|nr:glycoside hydrolase family 140 protein [Lachnospiraceae bacterium]
MNEFDHPVKISKNKHYFTKEDKPFFWLGDTAWLLFTNITEDEAYVYLKNRAEKGFNVIQSVLVYATEGLNDNNKMPTRRYDVEKEEYWTHCDKVIRIAEELGLYMALLPAWGSIVKNNILNTDNAEKYADFLARRYENNKNIIWILGGDIKPEGYEPVYEKMAQVFKRIDPDKLIGFHPFGRCSSSLWFNDAKWLDFNIFQSGHRRYDQCELGAWDDTSNIMSMYGEDNWKYVEYDLSKSNRPTLDGEPSYEWIVQGLHDDTQPYWIAKDVRRYAYWSVFAGAAGHTYGDNSIIMFFDGNKDGVVYGAKEHWKDSLHHAGSGQMGYLKELMLSVDFQNGSIRDDLLAGGQRERYERIAVFAGENFLMAYNYLGKDFSLNTKDYIGKDIWLFRPATGIYSYMGKVDKEVYDHKQIPSYNEDTDMVLLIK